MASTMKDIARHTGLGLATISKYLNGGKVRPENKEAIERAIRALNFSVNEAARILKTNHSRMIGIIIPELSNLFITTMISAMEDILRRHGYALIICDCRTNASLEAEAVRFLMQKGSEAIVNMPVCQDGTHLLPALEKGVSVVLVDRLIPSLRDCVDVVMIDNVRASYMATEHLLSLGHERIGAIFGPEQIYTSYQRLQGYREAFIQRSLPVSEHLIAHSDYSMRGGYECMKRILTKNRDMTAVFATNYEMTLGAIMALNERHMRFPDDLSFIGFDHLELTNLVQPSLTGISQPLEHMGRDLAELLISRLDDREAPHRIIISQPQLMLGESTRACCHS